MAISAMMTRDEFDRILNSYSGRLISIIPVTKTTSSDYGEETLTESATTSLKVHFVVNNDAYNFEKNGLDNTADALMLVRGEDTIVKDSLAKVNNNLYRVQSVQAVYGTFNGDTVDSSEIVYYFCLLYLQRTA